ncbi:MAG: hypothetical protein M5R36_24585 [Deltaproteobacteria bacterium]|nr:hypothetical protein [Deltaproteobacteria bacterium]
MREFGIDLEELGAVAFEEMLVQRLAVHVGDPVLEIGRGLFAVQRRQIEHDGRGDGRREAEHHVGGMQRPRIVAAAEAHGAAARDVHLPVAEDVVDEVVDVLLVGVQPVRADVERITVVAERTREPAEALVLLHQHGGDAAFEEHDAERQAADAAPDNDNRFFRQPVSTRK